VRRLRDFQSVTITTNGVTTTATVSAVDRGVAQLDLHDTALASKLTLPASVELNFIHRGHYVLLMGTLATDGDRWFTFMPEARGLVASRRTAPRLQVGLAVRVTRSSGIVVNTETVDVSASGVLLADAKLGRPLDVVQLQLTLPGSRPALVAEARIIRVGWAETALRFTNLSTEGQTTLKALVADVRFTLAQRFTEQREAS
jgi:hypothetical protein